MLNLSRIQLELERAKEKLRSVEETIQKVEGKTFSNGPVRYGGLKTDYHSDKTRNSAAVDDAKNPRRRLLPSTIDSRIQRLPIDDSSFGLKRGLREKREPGLGFKRQVGDARPQGVFARLSGTPYHHVNEEEEDDLGKKPTLPSRVYTTATEVPSRQEVIAAQALDEQSKERNKRMFGALVGTLQKFRKEETRVREREEKRMKVEKKLEEDAKREKEKLMQEKRELFLEKKRREVEIKRIEWSLNRVKEYEAWEADMLPLKNFIQTQAKPHIFYLPSVHNAKTGERLAHSQKVVEKMIEKRKNNLKEEIENSEKKAKKAAAEDVEEEEAENIPEDNEESVHTEQQIQVDFETKNKENGFIEEGKKLQTDSTKHVDSVKEPTKEEKSRTKEVEIVEAKESDEVSDNENEKEKNESCSCDQEESKEEISAIDNKDSNNDLISISEERLSDKTGEGHLGDTGNGNGNGNEEKMRETGEYDETKSESNDMIRGHPTESLEAKENVEVPSKETENTEKISEKVAEEKIENTEFVQSDENLEPISIQTDSKPLLSESERKPEDNSKKKLESHDEKKTGSLPRDKSETRKTSRRSPKKSGSPRNSSRSKRRSSSSRQKRTSRRQSSSNSPPRKSRRSRSPVSKRGQRNFSLKRRSPHNKSRKRKSSSRSSSSSSLKKKRSRSLSSSSSKSD